jgi:hypothetical protein
MSFQTNLERQIKSAKPVKQVCPALIECYQLKFGFSMHTGFQANLEVSPSLIINKLFQVFWNDNSCDP